MLARAQRDAAPVVGAAAHDARTKTTGIWSRERTVYGSPSIVHAARLGARNSPKFFTRFCPADTGPPRCGGSVGPHQHLEIFFGINVSARPPAACNSGPPSVRIFAAIAATRAGADDANVILFLGERITWGICRNSPLQGRVAPNYTAGGPFALAQDKQSPAPYRLFFLSSENRKIARRASVSAHVGERTDSTARKRRPCRAPVGP